MTPGANLLYVPEMTPETVDQVVAVLASGGSQRAAARTVGVAPSSIQKLLARDPDVRDRVTAARARTRANQGRKRRRTSEKIRALHGITEAQRPELARPDPGADAALERARAGATRGSTAAKATGRSRVLDLGITGPTIFDGPLAMEYAGSGSNGRWRHREMTREEWDLRGQQVTLRDSSGKRTWRVIPGTEDHARLLAEGFR